MAGTLREPIDFDEAIALAADEQTNKDVSDEILSKYYTKHHVANNSRGG